jgi:hypothetical protein
MACPAVASQNNSVPSCGALQMVGSIADCCRKLTRKSLQCSCSMVLSFPTHRFQSTGSGPTGEPHPSVHGLKSTCLGLQHGTTRGDCSAGSRPPHGCCRRWPATSWATRTPLSPTLLVSESSLLHACQSFGSQARAPSAVPGNTVPSQANPRRCQHSWSRTLITTTHSDGTASSSLVSAA